MQDNESLISKGLQSNLSRYQKPRTNPPHIYNYEIKSNYETETLRSYKLPSPIKQTRPMDNDPSPLEFPKLRRMLDYQGTTPLVSASKKNVMNHMKNETQLLIDKLQDP